MIGFFEMNFSLKYNVHTEKYANLLYTTHTINFLKVMTPM